MMYSIIYKTNTNGLEPYYYLKQLFEQLPLATPLEDYEQLLPWNCKASPPSAENPTPAVPPG